MAKSKTSNAPTPLAEYKPRLYLDLEKGDVGLIEDLKVGKEVTLRVTGKVVGLEYRESTDEKGKTRERGSIQLEDYHVSGVGSNDFADLADDD